MMRSKFSSVHSSGVAKEAGAIDAAKSFDALIHHGAYFAGVSHIARNEQRLAASLTTV